MPMRYSKIKIAAPMTRSPQSALISHLPTGVTLAVRTILFDSEDLASSHPKTDPDQTRR